MNNDVIKQKLGRRSVLKGLTAAAGAVTLGMPTMRGC
jgi:secreted PhoX family phosphatase